MNQRDSAILGESVKYFNSMNHRILRRVELAGISKNPENFWCKK